MASGPLLAIETGGTKILACMEDDAGRRLSRWTTTTPEQAFADIVAFAGVRPAAIGFAGFGPMLLSGELAGQLLATPKPHWTGANLAQALASHFDCRVAVDTDVNAAAMAERAAEPEAIDSLAYITVGTGIGAGLAQRHGSLRGVLHPELGHIRLVRQPGDDAPSACPFHEDCAEGLAAGPALQMRLAGTELTQRPDITVLAANYLAQLVMTIVRVWSPHRIVLGGGVGTAPGMLASVQNAVRQTIGHYAMVDDMLDPCFIRAPRHRDAGLEGALMLARGEVRGAG